ncbi:helix-turn-helix domain-containing protein [Streptomyces sp. ACA25]|uniref:helix-turn-helix domain-containing protein n=1 Tax=Streptomyces sp. ACA25 TaxID=3022596 RepID=UPI0023076A62|nr:helix-turn-helix domain-containing protein [Streptomyces sp. ACA25]MDB1090210.1 helix-turn-helix domain-containing protein [Streptomyces sp. ACA25]
MTLVLDTGAATAGTREDVPRLGTLIRSHRLRIGLTQRELADLSTISVRAIRDLEQDRVRRPRTDTVGLIAEGLRLGPRARTALEAAARHGRTGAGCGHDFEAEAPAPPTAPLPLVGRETETGVITGELASGAERLVNVVGISGVGKTRLALEVAGRLHREAGLPVLWCPCPGTEADYLSQADSALTAPLTALVTGLFGDGAAGQRSPVPSPADGNTVAELLGDRPALLVIDGAPATPDTGLLHRLLRDCPGLRLLVTSEGPWDIPGERPFLLAPLEVPCDGGPSVTAPQAGADHPAVHVFLDQARRVRPGFAPTATDLEGIAEVCRRLDGLPGPLRAAASWLALYDLPMLCRRLGNDPTPYLDHLADSEHSGRFRDALSGRLARLPRGHRALLDALCGCGQGKFTLDDVERLTGESLRHCGRTVRDLLLCGAVRPLQGAARAQFQVLHLVRAVQSALPVPAGTTRTA